MIKLVSCVLWLFIVHWLSHSCKQRRSCDSRLFVPREWLTTMTWKFVYRRNEGWSSNAKFWKKKKRPPRKSQRALSLRATWLIWFRQCSARCAITDISTIQSNEVILFNAIWWCFVTTSRFHGQTKNVQNMQKRLRNGHFLGNGTRSTFFEKTFYTFVPDAKGGFRGSIGAIASPKTHESNFIHHDFLQFGKQHSQYKAILSSIVLSQQYREVYSPLLQWRSRYETLNTKYY